MKKLFKAKTKKLGWIFLDYAKDGLLVVNFADACNSSVWLVPGTENLK